MMYALSLEELMWARVREIREEVGPRRKPVDKRPSAKDRRKRSGRV